MKKVYKVKLEYTDCPTKTDDWIYITDYKNDNRKYLYVNKKVLKNKETEFVKNRNIFIFVLPDFNKYDNKFVYNNKSYSTVYYPLNNNNSFYSFLIFDENTVELKNNLNKLFWFNPYYQEDSRYPNERINDSNIKEKGWIEFRHYLKLYNNEIQPNTISVKEDENDSDTIIIDKSSVFYNFLPHNLDKKNATFTGPNKDDDKEFVYLYKSSYMSLEMEDKIAQFINEFKKIKSWNEKPIISNFLNLNNKWVKSINNEFGTKIMFRVGPSNITINQNQLKIAEVDDDSNYINNKIVNINNNQFIYLYESNINSLIILPNIIPTHDLKFEINFNKFNIDEPNSELYLPQVKLLDSVLNNNFKYDVIVRKDSTNNNLSSLINFLKIIDFSHKINIGKGSLMTLNWTIKSDDNLYNNLSGSLTLGFLSIRFRLNFSGASILANLDSENNLTKKPPVNNDTLCGNFNTIIMNVHSDYEYLIVESLPFNRTFEELDDLVDITIKSDNETVFETNTYKNILLSNTKETLRLQRMGNPTDYFAYNNLINIKCKGYGIANLTFKVHSKNQYLSNVKIAPIKIVGISIVSNEINALINSARLTETITFNLVPEHICKHLINVNSEVWFNDNKKKIEIDLHKTFDILGNNYLDNYLYMVQDNDISLNNQKYIPSKNDMGIEIHFKQRKKRNNIEDDGEIDFIKKKNFNSTQFDLTIRGIKKGIIELLPLVNSLQNIPPYLKKNLTFNNESHLFPNDFLLKNNTSDPINDVWPANIINNDFTFREGINKDTGEYDFVSNNGPNLLNCNKNKTYGWIEKSDNVFDTGMFLIDNVENFIKERIEKDNDDDICNLLYGKVVYDVKTNTKIYDKDFWVKKGYDIDFYAEAVLDVNNLQRKNPRNNYEYDISYNLLHRTIDELYKRPDIGKLNYNEIKQYYKNDEFLFVYCNGYDTSNMLKKDKFGNYMLLNSNNNKIKLVLGKDGPYKDDIFVVKEILDKWSNKSNYLLKLVPFKDPFYTEFTIEDDIKIDYDDKLTDIYWIKDNTLEIQIREINIINKKILDLKVIIFNYEKKYFNLINEKFSNLKKDKRYFENNTGTIIFAVQEYELRNIKIFINEYINITHDLIDDIFKPLLDEYNYYLNRYKKLLKTIEENKFFDRNFVYNEKETLESKVIDVEKQTFDFVENNALNKDLNIEDILNRYLNNLNTIVLTQKNDIILKVDEFNRQEEEKKKIEEEEANSIKYILTDKMDKVEWYSFSSSDDDIFSDIEIPRIDITARDRHYIEIFAEYPNEIGDIIKNDAFNTEISYIKNIDLYIKQLSSKTIGGNGGIFWGKYDKRNDWSYFWKEWDIKYYVRNIPQPNFNIIYKYNKIEKNNMVYLQLYCKGFGNLNIILNSYEIMNSRIKINNFDTIYDINTIFLVEKLTELDDDNYIIEIQPIDNVKFKSSFSDFADKESYWTIENIDEIIIIEDELQVECELDGENIVTNEDTLKDKWIPSVVLKIPSKDSQGNIINYPIKWASYSKQLNKIVIEPFLFKNDIVKFTLESNFGYQIRLWSKINNLKYGTMDNYYINEVFDTMPVAELGKTTFGIFSGGSSDNYHQDNVTPKKDIWFPTKFPIINVNVIYYPAPLIYDYTIGSSMDRVDIFWKMDLPKNQQGKNLYDVFKFNNENGVWDIVSSGKNVQQYTDRNVVSFNSYRYKVLAYTYYYNKDKLEYSDESNILSVFVCGFNRFPNGRFQPKFREKRCSDGTVIRQNVYKNTSNTLTKKQIYAKLAKKNGGGPLTR